MLEVLPELMRWWHRGDTACMATVVDTFRSAPRLPGASMLRGPDGSAVGSVSGGCIEGAVYEAAAEVVSSGVPALNRYGVSDADAFSVGLTCGGVLDVFLEKVDQTEFPQLATVAEDVERGDPVAIATVIAHPDRSRIGKRLIVRPSGVNQGSLGSQRSDDATEADATGMLANGSSATLTYGPDGERRGDSMRVFVRSLAPRPRMLVFGAIDFAAAVARASSFLGYRVTVCDARPIFATASRFPDADEVVVEWPHRYLQHEASAGRIDERTAIVVLTHDPKFDSPLLEVAMRLSRVGYVGAMGSRRTHAERLDSLIAAGLDKAALSLLSSPIGLDLGARTPEETAISIVAEIVAQRWGGTGAPLSTVNGPIHVENAHTKLSHVES